MSDEFNQPFSTINSRISGRHSMTTLNSRQYYSKYEKSLLKGLVTKYHDIIQSRQNDSTSIKIKSTVWEEIASEFNSQEGVYKRTSQQLKKCWENLKSREKLAMNSRMTIGKHSTTSDSASRSAGVFVPSPGVKQEDCNDYSPGSPACNAVDLTRNCAPPQDQSVFYRTYETDNTSPTPTNSLQFDFHEAPPTKKFRLSPIKTMTVPSLDSSSNIHQMELQLLNRKLEIQETEHATRMQILDAELRFWNKLADNVMTLPLGGTAAKVLE